ncbi:hypothetical protein F4604DRAFT_1976217 [Suillus subluteus]|nr:hypothetical protein F4604DRAFT_1976217 [Suillus subluteus]
MPTFTQHLMLGPLSILVLLTLVLKYLFFIPTESETETIPFHLLSKLSTLWHQDVEEDDTDSVPETEAAHWFNIRARQVVEVYRAKLQQDLTGCEAIEVSRRNIEDQVLTHLHYHIRIHSLNLGMFVPKFANTWAMNDSEGDSAPTAIEFDVSYTNNMSVSLSASYLFNYPMSSFAELTISLTICLSLLKSKDSSDTSNVISEVG